MGKHTERKVGLPYHPRYGEILYCNFDHQQVPEMVKTRPVIVVSRKHTALCTVVPLSGTPPEPEEAWNFKLIHVPEFLPGNDWWVKADCLTTVGLFRLDRAKIGKCPRTGKRLYATQRASEADLIAVRKAILAHIPIGPIGT